MTWWAKEIPDIRSRPKTSNRTYAMRYINRKSLIWLDYVEYSFKLHNELKKRYLTAHVIYGYAGSTRGGNTRERVIGFKSNLEMHLPGEVYEHILTTEGLTEYLYLIAYEHGIIYPETGNFWIDETVDDDDGVNLMTPEHKSRQKVVIDLTDPSLHISPIVKQEPGEVGDKVDEEDDVGDDVSESDDEDDSEGEESDDEDGSESVDDEYDIKDAIANGPRAFELSQIRQYSVVELRKLHRELIGPPGRLQKIPLFNKLYQYLQTGEEVQMWVDGP